MSGQRDARQQAEAIGDRELANKLRKIVADPTAFERREKVAYLLETANRLEQRGTDWAKLAGELAGTPGPLMAELMGELEDLGFAPRPTEATEPTEGDTDG